MLIGIVGFAGSGKGTVGDILVSEYGFQSDSYAAPVKDAVAVIFGWERRLLEGDTQASRTFREKPDPYWSTCFGRPFTPREALQKMGTECGRNVYHTNIWVDALEQRISNPYKDYVITDTRFPNEVAQVRRMGGKIVRVVRGIEPLWFDYALEWNAKFPNPDPQVMDKFPGIHYSEFAWIGQPIDVTLNNDGTLDELKAQIKTMIDDGVNDEIK